MPSISRVRNYIIAGVSAAGGAALFYYGVQTYNKKRAFNSWTTNYIPSSEKWDKNWDHRDPLSLVKPAKGDFDDNRFNEAIVKVKPKAIRHLILVRHGQYNLDGKTDVERTLTALGKEQAKFTGERLKNLALPYSTMVRSTMTRANQTAKIIQQALPEIPVEDCSMIEEGAPIPPEPPIGHWRPEATQFYQDGARIEAAFRKYFHRAESKQKEDSFDLIVCHANVIRYFVCRALQFPAEGWLRLSLHHCSITWVSILPSGRVILRTMGDMGHLPPAALSS